MKQLLLSLGTAMMLSLSSFAMAATMGPSEQSKPTAQSVTETTQQAPAENQILLADDCDDICSGSDDPDCLNTCRGGGGGGSE